MANLPETPDYPAGVYQLETSDPVLGGPGGIANRQAEQLGNRTAWLKAKVDAFIDGTVAVLKATKLATARTLSFSGAASGSAPFDGSADANIVLTLADSGAVAGTYPKVSVNAKGLVTAGAPLAGTDIPTNLALTGSPSAPTPPQFDADQSIATMEAVQRALGSCSGFRDCLAGVAFTAADAGKYITYSTDAPASFTLPDPATLPSGTRFYFEAVGSAAPSTFSASGKSFAGPNRPGASTVSFVVPGETACEFIAIGNSYRVVGGSGKASLGASGYQRLPGGMVRYFGSVTVPANTANHPVTLPTAYQNQILKVLLSPSLTALNNYSMLGWMNKTLNGFGITNPNAGAVIVDWETIGN